MCLAQGHNAVMLVRLESTPPRSRVKHSSTEPLRSLSSYVLDDTVESFYNAIFGIYMCFK